MCIHNVKANSQASNIRVYVMTTQKGQKPKLQDTQLRVSKFIIYAFWQKIQQGGLGSRKGSDFIKNYQQSIGKHWLPTATNDLPIDD